MAHTIHLLTAQNSAAKRSVSRSRILFSRTSALQSGIHHEKEGTSIDDEFTKQKLIKYMWLCLIFIVNSSCSTRVVNIQFNCDCATKENAGNNQGKNDAYFQFISLSSRIWCIQASRSLEINEFWKINLFCNPFPSIYNVNEKELAQGKVVEGLIIYNCKQKKMVV